MVYAITAWLIYQRFSDTMIRRGQFNAKTHNIFCRRGILPRPPRRTILRRGWVPQPIGRGNLAPTRTLFARQPSDRSHLSESRIKRIERIRRKRRTEDTGRQIFLGIGFPNPLARRNLDPTISCVKCVLFVGWVEPQRNPTLQSTNIPMNQ